MTRHLLEVDDLDHRRAARRCSTSAQTRRRRRRCWRARARPCSSRSRRTAPATPPRWPWCSSAATRSTSSPTRSASTAASRPRTWPAPCACYHSVICARVFDHARARADGRRPVDVPVVNLLSDRSHPLQAMADLLTHPPPSSATSPGARWPGSATTPTWPARSAWPRPWSAWRSGSPARRATTRRPTTWPGSPRSAAASSRGRRRPQAAWSTGADVVVDRRLVLDGPGGRGGRPAADLRALPGRRRADVGGRRRRHLPPLPARPPGRGGHRRGARRPREPGLARGRQPAPGRARRPRVAARRPAGSRP